MENYKLKSEIKEFILQKAREHPELGCRKLSGLIQEVFKVNISKSTVGTVLKSEGLNKTVGRRSAKKNDAEPQVTSHITVQLLEAPCHCAEPLESAPAAAIKEEPDALYPNMGCWFLKAAELSLGGIQAISDILSSIKNDSSPSDLVAVLETLLYLALFGAQEYKDLSPALRGALAVLTGSKYSGEDGKRRLDYLEPSQPVALAIRKAKPLPYWPVSQELFNRLVALRAGVLALKFILEDSSFFFLDAGCHSIWSTSRIPKYFNSGLQKTKECLKESMAGIKPIALQAPPGFNSPTPAFLNFLAGFQCEKPAQAIKRIELYSEDNLLIDTIQPLPQKKWYFILGLWPWQYKNRDFIQGFGGSPLRSLAMINNDDRKVLDIITNLEKDKYDDNEVIGHYLEHWPNLEIGYQDFLNKIGHFYQRPQTELRQKNNVQFTESRDLTINVLLDYWRQELNLYCQRYFFPLSCREWDFLLLKERFYNLRARVDSETDRIKVIFELAEGFVHLKDLGYGCQRVNEADIHLPDGRKLVFERGAE